MAIKRKGVHNFAALFLYHLHFSHSSKIMSDIKIKGASYHDPMRREPHLQEPDQGRFMFRHKSTRMFQDQQSNTYTVEDVVLPVYMPPLIQYDLTLRPIADSNRYTLLSLVPQPVSCDLKNHSTSKPLADFLSLVDSDESNRGKKVKPSEHIRSFLNQLFPTSNPFIKEHECTVELRKRVFQTSPVDNVIQLLEAMQEEKGSVFASETVRVLDITAVAPYLIVLDCPSLLRYYTGSYLNMLTFQQRRALLAYIRKQADIRYTDLYVHPLRISAPTIRPFEAPPISFLFVVCTNTIYECDAMFRPVRKQNNGSDALALLDMLGVWYYDTMVQDLILSMANTMHERHSSTGGVMWNKAFKLWNGTLTESGKAHALCKNYVEYMYQDQSIPNIYEYGNTRALVDTLIDRKALFKTEGKTTNGAYNGVFLITNMRYDYAERAYNILLKFTRKDKPTPPIALLPSEQMQLITTHQPLPQRPAHKPVYIKAFEDFNFARMDPEQRETMHQIETNRKGIVLLDGPGGCGKTYCMSALQGRDASFEMVPSTLIEAVQTARDASEKGTKKVDAQDVSPQPTSKRTKYEPKPGENGTADVRVEIRPTILRLTPLNTQKNTLIDTVGAAFTWSHFIKYCQYNAFQETFGEVHTVVYDETNTGDEFDFCKTVVYLEKLPRLVRIVMLADRYQRGSVSGGNVHCDLRASNAFVNRNLTICHRVEEAAKFLFHVVQSINRGDASFLDSIADHASCFQIRNEPLHVSERLHDMSRKYYDEIADLALDDPVNVQATAFSNDFCDLVNKKIQERKLARYSPEEASVSETVENQFYRERCKLMPDQPLSDDAMDLTLEQLSNRKQRGKRRHKGDNTEYANYLKLTELRIGDKIRVNEKIHSRVPEWMSRFPEFGSYVKNYSYTLEADNLFIVRRFLKLDPISGASYASVHEMNTSLYYTCDHRDVEQGRIVVLLQEITRVTADLCEAFKGQRNPELRISDSDRWIVLQWKHAHIDRLSGGWALTVAKCQSLQYNHMIVILEQMYRRKDIGTAIGRAKRSVVVFNTDKALTIKEALQRAMHTNETPRLTILSLSQELVGKTI
jgi:hypothetical protein